MIAPPEFLISLTKPWADFYSDSKLAETLVTFAHVGALVVGGGIAIAADRMTLRTSSDVERKRHLLDVAQAHRAVIISLVVVVLSGLTLFTTDVEAFWGSWIYWTKMGLVVLLLINGARMQGIERKAAADPVVSTAHWTAYRGAAITSLVLWLATTLAGVALVNYA